MNAYTVHDALTAFNMFTVYATSTEGAIREAARMTGLERTTFYVTCCGPLAEAVRLVA